MRNKHLLLWLAFTLVLPASAQRQWANAAEYEMCQQATGEREPARRIEVLLKWEAGYPDSEYRRERIGMLASAYQSAGQPAEAFARAAELIKLDSSDAAASLMIAALALELPSPSPGQIKITEEAANYLLSHAADVGRTATAVPQAATDSTPDPETQRVAALLRDWRRGKRVRTAADVESEVRKVSEKALAWAKSVSK